MTKGKIRRNLTSSKYDSWTGKNNTVIAKCQYQESNLTLIFEINVSSNIQTTEKKKRGKKVFV